jgi:CBS domain containing-hemolysin-like protein
MNPDALFWLAIIGIAAASLAATAARTLRDFSRRELEELSERRQNQDRFADILHHHDRVQLGVDMLVVCLITLGVTCGALWAWLSWLPDSTSPQSWWLLVAVLAALALVLTIATVWLPWSICRVAAAQFLYHTWPLWSLVGRAFYPLVWGARAVDMLLHRATGRKSEAADEDTIEEEILTIVSEGQREGLIEEDAREMIEGVMELGDAVVSHIMTPRTEVEMLHVNTPWDEVIEAVIESGHTRVPVYDKSRDDVVGVLYVKDLLPELAKDHDEPRRPLAELVRKPHFVPETKAVDDVLQWFQKSRTHIAVVLDEFGGVSGLVSIEDVLEEIVGEIDDEYDQKSEDLVRKIDDDVCEPLGRAHIDEINAAMGFDLPDENYDTIGGFVFAEFGRVPAVGESMTWNDKVRVTVLEASRRRVNRVRLERVRKESLEAV